MPRFVVLEHDWPERHWDLLLEAGSVLQAWRLFREPTATDSIPAEPNADHRLIYLDYEGPISGDRGSVTRWDSGEYHVTPTGIQFFGTKLRGQAEWRPDSEVWLFSEDR